MNYRRFLFIAFLASLLVCLGSGPGRTAFFRVYAQQSTDVPTAATATIRAESRLVLVDVVVTDKKGSYVEDLAQKDFRIFQDDQEQKIANFSFEQSAAPENVQKRHLVLFFDDESMQPADQTRARAAAGKFLDRNSGNGNYVAVIDYAGTMQVAQNFTNDVDRLKKVVSAPKMVIAQSESASLGSSLFTSNDSYSNRNVLLALRSVARSLSSIPGRKSLIWLTSGFPLTPDGQAEMTALINVCNKANVVVYALDVRGLAGAVTMSSLGLTHRDTEDPEVESASFSPKSGSGDSGTPHLVYVQAKTGGSGPTTGTRPGATTGTRPVTTAPPPGWTQTPLSQQSRSIVPPLPPSTAINLQVLYAVSTGTGGFVISNSNDLLSGLEKIGKEQTEYYLLGFVPPESQEGSCHTLRIKVERSGTQVRARSGYCVTRPVDFLAGKPVAKQLEDRALRNQPGAIAGSVSAPFFYTSPETARVNLALELPGKAIQFEKVKGKYQAVVNVLGIAVKPDGTVAARFSDTVELSLEKNELEDFANRPYHYENQFYIAGGQYSLKLAVNSGDKYGQYELPLVIDHYDPAKFSISDLALSRQFVKITDMSTALDAQLLQDRTPLVTQGLAMVPSGTNRFKNSDRVAIYVEVYAPQNADAAAPKIGLRLRIVDKQSGESRLEAGIPDTSSSMIPGNPVIPMGVPLPIDRLQPGTYVVELRATDSAAHASVARKAEFSIE